MESEGGRASEVPAGEPDAARPAPVTMLRSPASGRAMAPELTRVGGEPALTWIEPDGSGGPGARVRFARLGADTEPVTIVEEGPRLFSNWADRPGVVQGGAGSEGPLFAWWLAKSGGDVYAYSVQVARSDDLGVTWRPLGVLHDDRAPAEHGFVSMVPEGDGVRAFWLDGRATPGGNPMTLRTVHVGEAIERATEELLDASVCDCCDTTAVATADGPVIFYRDRTGEEIRDHRAVRRDGDGWSEPYVLSEDGWRIAACPVNGPASVVSGDTVWTAWFTGADDRPRVYAARSTDGGRTFSEPLLIDGAGTLPPLGRLGLTADPSGSGEAFVSWLGTTAGPFSANGADGADATEGERVAALRVRRLTAGGMGPVVEVARTESSRASGVPRVLFDAGPDGDRLLLAWVEPREGDGTTVRLAALATSAVPARAGS